MTYTVQSYSWGKALLDPNIIKFKVETIEEAKRICDRQWRNPECFHVRALSLFDRNDPLNPKHYLHFMKSRPTKDRELRHFFEKITIPNGMKGIYGGGDANLLRVCDYDSETPTRRLHLPASEFYFNIHGAGTEEVNLNPCLDGSKALNLEDFETCLAAAAFMPTRIDLLLGAREDDWYFLSEVIITKSRAELSFSLMESGQEYFQ